MNKIKKKPIKLEESRILSLNSSSSDEEGNVDDTAQSIDTNKCNPIQLRERKNLQLFFKLSYKLVTLDLRNCSISTADVLEVCAHLRFVCLAENFIEQLPLCLPSLRCLQFLDLSSNKISSPKGLMILRNASPSLLYLNLIANPVTRLPRYRSFVIGAAKSLLALDNHLISDEELIPNAFFRSHFSAGHKRMQINMTITKFRIINKDKYVHLYVDTLVKCLKRYHACNSPVIIIQRAVRDWLTKLKTLPRIWAITKLQAYYRGKSYRQRIRVEMNKILLESWRIAPHVQTLDDRQRMSEQARVVQYYWRKYHKLKMRIKSITLLQRWIRRNLKRKSDALKWFDKFGIAGFFFPEYYKNAITSAAMYRNKTALTFHEDVNPILRIKLYKYTTHIKNWKKQTFCFLSHRPEASASPSGIIPPSSPTKSKLAERIKRMARYTSNYDKWISVSSSIQIRSFSILKARGVHFSKSTLKGFRKRLTNDVNDFKLGALSLLYYRPKDISDLYLLTQSIWRTHAVVPIYWDVQVFEDCAAADIQRVWRGSRVRRVMLPFMVTSLLRLRGAVAIQRWWRTRKGLIDRLQLLKAIADVCRRISTPFLYFDAWVFYLLLQCQQSSPLTYSMSQYPEFRGTLLDDITREEFFFSIPPTEDFLSLTLAKVKSSSRSRMNCSSSLELINAQFAAPVSASASVGDTRSNSSINTPPLSAGLSPQSYKIHINSPRSDINDSVGNQILGLDQDRDQESLQRSEIKTVKKISTTPHALTAVVTGRVGVPRWFTWCRLRPKMNAVPVAVAEDTEGKYYKSSLSGSNDSIHNEDTAPQLAAGHNTTFEMCTLNKLMSKYCDVNVKKVPELANSLLSQFRNSTEATRGAPSPVSSNKNPRRYLVDSSSDSLEQSAFRIIEMKFSSIEQARRRCTLIMLMTYDSAHRMTVVPMSASSLQQKMREKLNAPMRDLPIYYNPKSWHDKRQSRIRSQLTSSIHKFMESNSEILPFEMRMVISEVSPWVILQQWDLRDVLRFRFLCEALKKRVATSAPKIIDALNQVDGNVSTNLLVKNFPPGDVILIEDSIPPKSGVQEDTIRYTSNEIDLYQALVKDKVIYSTAGNRWSCNGTAAAAANTTEIDWKAASAIDLLIIADPTQLQSSRRSEDTPPVAKRGPTAAPLTAHSNRNTTTSAESSISVSNKSPGLDNPEQSPRPSEVTSSPHLSTDHADVNHVAIDDPVSLSQSQSERRSHTAKSSHHPSPSPPSTSLRPSSSARQLRCHSAGNTALRNNRILRLSSQQLSATAPSHDSTASLNKPYLSSTQEMFDQKNKSKRQLESKDLAVATRLEKLQSLNLQQLQDEQRLLKEIEEQKKREEDNELHRKAMNTAIKLDNSNIREVDLLEDPGISYADKLTALKAEEVKQVRNTTKLILNKIREDTAFYCDNRNLKINEEVMNRQIKREKLTADRNKKLLTVITAKHNHFHDISIKKNDIELQNEMEKSAAKSRVDAIKVAQRQKREVRATAIASGCLFTALTNQAQSEFRKKLLQTQADKLKDKVRQGKVTRHRSQMIRSALFQREKVSQIDDDITIEVEPVSPRSFQGGDAGDPLADIDEEAEEGNSTSLFSKRPVMKKRASVVQQSGHLGGGTDEGSSNKSRVSKATSGAVSRNALLPHSRMNSNGDLYIISRQTSATALHNSRGGDRGVFHGEPKSSSSSIVPLSNGNRRGSAVKTVTSEHQSSLLYSESSKGISSETSEPDLDEESSLDMKSSNDDGGGDADSDDEDEDSGDA